MSKPSNGRVRVAVICILILACGCGCSAPGPDEVDTAFCEATSQVFPVDVKGMFAVSAADIDQDDRPDIYFNNHHLKVSNVWMNDGGTFSDAWDTVGIREIPWVANVFERPLFTPDDLGYFIWHDTEYQWRWKVRWTGGGEPHDFSGSICPALAFYKEDLVRDPIAVGDGVTARRDENSCIVFNAPASAGVRGIDVFSTRPPNGLLFDLRIDGESRPERTFVGGKSDVPPEAPFWLWLSDRHACAWGDYDNDGRADLFISRGGIQGALKPPHQGKWDELYRNRGDGHLENTYFEAGFALNHIRGRGAMWSDVDSDGLLDLSLGGLGSTLYFYRNAGGGKFEPVTLAGVNGNNCSLMNWVDVDADGDQDLLLAGCWHDGDGVLLNKGNLQFEDATERAGLSGSSGRYARFRELVAAGELFWGAMFFPADYDNDGDLDLLISSPEDRGGCRLLRNEGESRFADVTAAAALPTEGPWTEGQWADYDNDGDLDLLLLSGVRKTDSRLYVNDGSGAFREAAGAAGINVERCLGAVFVDVDGDGFLDVAAIGEPATEPELRCPDEPNREIAHYLSKSIRFRHLLGIQRKPIPWISDRETYLPKFKHLFKNLGNENHWIALDLEGTRSNRDGLGARVVLDAGGHVQTRQAGNLNKGRYSQSRLPVHFGLGIADTIDSIEVRWPSGTRQVLTNVPADQRLTIVEPE